MEILTQKEHKGELQPGVLRVRSDGKRIYAEEFKAELVKRCLVPGTSVAATGMAHGINANLLRRWIVMHGDRARRSASPALLPVTVREQSLASAPVRSVSCAPTAPEFIEIELYGARVRLHGPIDAPRLGVVLAALAQRR